jgi:hypothetical protein
VTLPIFVFLFVGVVMIGNIWLARVELENSLEAAALAAVKEWGDAGGGDTLIPRNVGVDFAAANTISGVPVEIATNYDYDGVTGNVNQNLLCFPTKPDPVLGLPPGGNLVFGAVTIENPGTPEEYVIFDAGTRPSCGAGEVIFDVSGQGKKGTNTDNWWGVSFRPTEDMPDGIRIKRITYNLRAGTSVDGEFITFPMLSDNEQPHKVVDQNSDQPDISGFVDPPSDQITFITYPATPWLLTIEFSPAYDGQGNLIDAGFEPCDRMRFGVSVEGMGEQNAKNDGDSIGHDAVQVSVIFEIGGEELDPVYATFVDTNDKSQDCQDDVTEPICGSMIVSSTQLPDVPCPPSSSAVNNGQSLALLHGGGGNIFGVRAQAIAPVVNPFCGFCGLTLQPHYVNVRTTAIYDCVERRPRLIRIDEYICPGPKP